MNIGDLVIQRSLLGFKGILLDMVYEMDSEIDEVQLALYNPEPERYWKVLWFQKNFYEPPSVEIVRERDMFKLERKIKNGL
tara:strand:+ start:936 stop:1178 length:243 start_codon:yes stop_codon:yes gene_type:complete